METSALLSPGAATMAVLAIVFLLLIYWVRRPDRQADQAATEETVSRTEP